MTLFCEWAIDRARWLEDTGDAEQRRRVHRFCSDLRAGLLLQSLWSGHSLTQPIATKHAQRPCGGQYSSCSCHHFTSLDIADWKDHYRPFGDNEIHIKTLRDSQD